MFPSSVGNEARICQPQLMAWKGGSLFTILGEVYLIWQQRLLNMEVGLSLELFVYHSASNICQKYSRKCTVWDPKIDPTFYIVAIRFNIRSKALLLVLHFIYVRTELFSSCNSSCQMRGSVARRSNYEQSWFGDGAVEWVAVKLGV